MGFPVAFELVRTVLAQHLNVRAVTEIPEKRPSRFVSIDSGATVGPMFSGVKSRVLTKRRLLIYCWGTDEVDAAEMCEEARDFLLRLPDLRIGIRCVDIVGEPCERAYIVNNQKVQDRSLLTVDVTLRSNPN